MRFGWRDISGPLLMLAIASLAVALDRHVSASSLAPLLIFIVALAGALSGSASAMTSAVLAVVCSVLLSVGHRATPDGIGLLAAAAFGTAGITGLMRERLLRGIAAEHQNLATATRLAAALDRIDIGIVLLDAETRAEYINPAFRAYFAVPNEIADGKPPFVALMYHGRDSGAFELPEDELGTFIAHRMETVRIGDATPINIALRSGDVLRFVCTALPDGGRMLSYAPVTDLVRHTDPPADAEHYRAMRAKRHGGLMRPLRPAL